MKNAQILITTFNLINISLSYFVYCVFLTYIRLFMERSVILNVILNVKMVSLSLMGFINQRNYNGFLHHIPTFFEAILADILSRHHLFIRVFLVSIAFNLNFVACLSLSVYNKHTWKAYICIIIKVKVTPPHYLLLLPFSWL